MEYFVSYYDYYQPRGIYPHDGHLYRKGQLHKRRIERLRHSATSSLSERRDVVVVSSVSCIYGLGDPIDYANMVISLRPGQQKGAGRAFEKAHRNPLRAKRHRL